MTMSIILCIRSITFQESHSFGHMSDPEITVPSIQLKLKKKKKRFAKHNMHILGCRTTLLKLFVVSENEQHVGTDNLSLNFSSQCIGQTT